MSFSRWDLLTKTECSEKGTLIVKGLPGAAESVLGSARKGLDLDRELTPLFHMCMICAYVCSAMCIYDGKYDGSVYYVHACACNQDRIGSFKSRVEWQ